MLVVTIYWLCWLSPARGSGEEGNGRPCLFWQPDKTLIYSLRPGSLQQCHKLDPDFTAFWPFWLFLFFVVCTYNAEVRPRIFIIIMQSTLNRIIQCQSIAWRVNKCPDIWCCATSWVIQPAIVVPPNCMQENDNVRGPGNHVLQNSSNRHWGSAAATAEREMARPTAKNLLLGIEIAG